MPWWMVLLLLTAANGMVGWLAGRRAGRNLDGLERLFLWHMVGAALNGWLAVGLAEWGIFRLSVWGAGWLALVGGLAWRQARRPAGVAPAPVRTVDTATRWGLLLWLPLALWLFLRPHAFVKGAADAGVYVNLAASIHDQGSLVIHDPTLAALDPALYPALLRPLPTDIGAPYLLFPGFYITDPAQGEVTPQFYPLDPVWRALAFGLGGRENGVTAALTLTGWWAIWGTLAIGIIARRLGGRWAGGLALVGLTLNGLQIWFARYPTTEALTQAFVWAGVAAITLALTAGDCDSPADRRLDRPAKTPPAATPDASLALAAGLLLGQALLARIDMFFLLAIPIGLWGWQRLAGRSSLLKPLGGMLVILGLHSFGHALWQSRPYFLSTYGYVGAVARQQAGWLLLAAGVGLGLWWLAPRLLAWTARYRLSALRPALAGGAALLLVGLALYAWFIRPQAAAGAFPDWYSGQSTPLLDHENLRRLGWYLGPAGVWLGVLGAARLVWRLERRTWLLVSVGLCFTLLYVWRIQANPHQVYAMRRYIPAVIPFLTLSAAVWLGSWWQAGGRGRPAAAALLAVVWLGSLAWLAQGLVSQVDDATLPAQLAQLNAHFAAGEPGAILLVGDTAVIGQGDFIGTPLHFLYGHDVYTLRAPDALDRAALAQQLTRWLGQRPVYWLETAGGPPWPLPDWPPGAGQPYQIESVTLEGVYTHRPRQIITTTWAGVIYPVTPP